MSRAWVLSTVVAASLSAGCLVEVRQVADPGPAFDRARAEAARVAGHSGRPHELNVLVYDRGESKLVKVSVPMWLVRKVAENKRGDLDLDGDAGECLHRVGRHLRFEDIDRAAAGTLIEVAEDDGAQVLVWLR